VIGVGRGGRHISRELHGGNRIWSGRGGMRLRCGVLRGACLPFALLLRGLDELGVGAGFDVGILRCGEGEAIVAKILKETFHISLLAQGSTRETKKQLYVRMGRTKTVRAGTGEVQKRYQLYEIIRTAVLRWDRRWRSV
jgi:hypothetical protein